MLEHCQPCSQPESVSRLFGVRTTGISDPKTPFLRRPLAHEMWESQALLPAVLMRSPSLRCPSHTVSGHGPPCSERKKQIERERERESE